MKVTTVSSASRAREVGVLRVLDLDQRRLVLLVGAHLRPAEVVELAAPQLTSEEMAAVREAFGLDQPPEAS